VVGFDLVGQEDKGKPLYSLLPALRDLPPTARLFLHGGEYAFSELNILDLLVKNY